MDRRVLIYQEIYCNIINISTSRFIVELEEIKDTMTTICSHNIEK